jgi:hypothetical protein
VLSVAVPAAEANGAVRAIIKWMPVVIPIAGYDPWLSVS